MHARAHTAEPNPQLSTWGERDQCGKYSIIKMQMSPCPPLTFGEFSEQPVTIVPSRLLETLIPTLKSQSLIFSPLEITRRIEKGLHAMVKK